MVSKESKTNGRLREAILLTAWYSTVALAVLQKESRENSAQKMSEYLAEDELLMRQSHLYAPPAQDQLETPNMRRSVSYASSCSSAASAASRGSRYDRRPRRRSRVSRRVRRTGKAVVKMLSRGSSSSRSRTGREKASFRYEAVVGSTESRRSPVFGSDDGDRDVLNSAIDDDNESLDGEIPASQVNYVCTCCPGLTKVFDSPDARE